MTPRLLEEANAIARNVAGLARARAGRLVGLTIALPPGTPGGDFERTITDSLAIAGLGPVDVTTRFVPGPPRALSLEFQR
jgi:hypothetical protein